MDEVGDSNVGSAVVHCEVVLFMTLIVDNFANFSREWFSFILYLFFVLCFSCLMITKL